MLSQSARIGAPVVGFAVGLLMTCGLADAARAAAVDTKEGVNYVSPPNPSWVVQLIGDSSEAVAVSRFRELQNKHKLLLGMYKTCCLEHGDYTRVRTHLDAHSRGAEQPRSGGILMFEIRSCWRTLRCSALGRRHRRCQPRAPAAGVRKARRACISPERFVVAIPGVATTAVATGTGQAAAAGGASDHNHHPRRNSTCHSPRWRHNRRHYRRCHNNRRYSKCRGGSRGVTFGSRVQPSALGRT